MPNDLTAKLVGNILGVFKLLRRESRLFGCCLGSGRFLLLRLLWLCWFFLCRRNGRSWRGRRCKHVLLATGGCLVCCAVTAGQDELAHLAVGLGLALSFLLLLLGTLGLGSLTLGLLAQLLCGLRLQQTLGFHVSQIGCWLSFCCGAEHDITIPEPAVLEVELAHDGIQLQHLLFQQGAHSAVGLFWREAKLLND